MGACIEIFFSEEMGKAGLVSDVFLMSINSRQCFNHQLLLRSYSSFYLSLCVCMCVYVNLSICIYL